MEYFISDTHFGHKGSLKWPNGNARLFENVQEMNSYMIQNWNKRIKDEDTVYFLGDFAYKCSEKEIICILHILKGKIVFIKGNHDGITLKANQKAHRFDSVHDRLDINIDGRLLVLDHYPIHSWKGKNRGSIHLHGHTHSYNPDIKGNIFNVSCENIDYFPVSLLEIEKRLKYKD